MSKETKDKPIKKISAEEFDRMFDEGEDISEYVDWSSAKMIYPETQRMNVDVPVWMLRSLDREAERLGISRQALVKTWLAEKIESRQKR